MLYSWHFDCAEPWESAKSWLAWFALKKSGHLSWFDPLRNRSLADRWCINQLFLQNGGCSIWEIKNIISNINNHLKQSHKNEIIIINYWYELIWYKYHDNHQLSSMMIVVFLCMDMCCFLSCQHKLLGSSSLGMTSKLAQSDLALFLSKHNIFCEWYIWISLLILRK